MFFIWLLSTGGEVERSKNIIGLNFLCFNFLVLLEAEIRVTAEMDPPTFHNVLFGHWYEESAIKNLKTSLAI